MESTCPQEHIKNISTCEAILTENWLETGRKTLVKKTKHTHEVIEWVYVEYIYSQHNTVVANFKAFTRMASKYFCILTQASQYLHEILLS